MLLELIIDLYREQRNRLLRGAAVLSAASLTLGFLAVLVPHRVFILFLTAWLEVPGADSSLMPQKYYSLVYAVFILPFVLAVLGGWECLRLFFTTRSRKTLGYILAYPLPRWKVFTSRITFLTGTGLLYASALCAGFSVSQALVSPQDSAWLIWAYLPGAFLLYIFYSFLTAALVFFTSRLWIGVLAGAAVFLTMYLLFFSPSLVSVNLRGFSLLSAYAQTGWAVNHPSVPGLLVPLAINVLIGGGLWWLFNRTDLD